MADEDRTDDDSGTDDTNNADDDTGDRTDVPDADSGDDQDSPTGDGDKPVHDPAKTERQLRRARAEAKRWREIAQGKRPRTADDSDDSGGDTDRGDRGPDFRTAAAVASGVTALQAAGYTGNLKRAQRLVATANLAGVEPGADGLFDPDDFDDVVADIKDEFPELFGGGGQDRRNTPVGTGPGFNRGGRSTGNGSAKMTEDERFAKRILGAAGYTSVADRIGRGARST
jgi:hypothetical protein